MFIYKVPESGVEIRPENWYEYVGTTRAWFLQQLTENSSILTVLKFVDIVCYGKEYVKEVVKPQVTRATAIPSENKLTAMMENLNEAFGMRSENMRIVFTHWCKNLIKNHMRTVAGCVHVYVRRKTCPLTFKTYDMGIEGIMKRYKVRNCKQLETLIYCGNAHLKMQRKINDNSVLHAAQEFILLKKQSRVEECLNFVERDERRNKIKWDSMIFKKLLDALTSRELAIPEGSNAESCIKIIKRMTFNQLTISLGQIVAFAKKKCGVHGFRVVEEAVKAICNKFPARPGIIFVWQALKKIGPKVSNQHLSRMVNRLVSSTYFRVNSSFLGYTNDLRVDQDFRCLSVALQGVNPYQPVGRNGLVKMEELVLLMSDPITVAMNMGLHRGQTNCVLSQDTAEKRHAEMDLNSKLFQCTAKKDAKLLMFLVDGTKSMQDGLELASSIFETRQNRLPKLRGKYFTGVVVYREPVVGKCNSTQRKSRCSVLKPSSNEAVVRGFFQSAACYGGMDGYARDFSMGFKVFTELVNDFETNGDYVFSEKLLITCTNTMGHGQVECTKDSNKHGFTGDMSYSEQCQYLIDNEWKVFSLIHQSDLTPSYLREYRPFDGLNNSEATEPASSRQYELLNLQIKRMNFRKIPSTSRLKSLAKKIEDLSGATLLSAPKWDDQDMTERIGDRISELLRRKFPSSDKKKQTQSCLFLHCVQWNGLEKLLERLIDEERLMGRNLLVILFNYGIRLEGVQIVNVINGEIELGSLSRVFKLIDAHLGLKR